MMCWNFKMKRTELKNNQSELFFQFDTAKDDVENRLLSMADSAIFNAVQLDRAKTRLW